MAAEWNEPTPETIDLIVEMHTALYLTDQKVVTEAEVDFITLALQRFNLNKQPVFDCKGLLIGLHRNGISMNSVFLEGVHEYDKWFITGEFDDLPIVIRHLSRTHRYTLGILDGKTFIPFDGMTMSFKE